MDGILRVLWVSALSFVAIIIIARIMGKKQLSQLGFVDYIVGISIGSIAGAMAVDPEIPFYHFIIALVVYLVIDLALNFLTKKSMFIKKAIKGEPMILIENGKLNYDVLKKSKIDINDLLSLCRTKDCFDLNEIAYCIFETSGRISILLKSHALTVTREDLDIEKPPSALSVELVEDGEIIDKALKQYNKSQEWLLEKLKVKSKKEVKQIALATYDEENDEVIINYKND